MSAAGRFRRDRSVAPPSLTVPSRRGAAAQDAVDEVGGEEVQRRRGGGGRALHGGRRAAGRPRAGFYRRGQRPAPRPGISISLARCRQGRGWDAPGTGRAKSRHGPSSGPRGVRGVVPVPPGCGTAGRRPCGLEGGEGRRLRSAEGGRMSEFGSVVSAELQRAEFQRAARCWESAQKHARDLVFQVSCERVGPPKGGRCFRRGSVLLLRCAAGQ